MLSFDHDTIFIFQVEVSPRTRKTQDVPHRHGSWKLFLNYLGYGCVGDLEGTPSTHTHSDEDIIVCLAFSVCISLLLDESLGRCLRSQEK
jgi:hypothetical protein